jgi:hypothetical protein
VGIIAVSLLSAKVDVDVVEVEVGGNDGSRVRIDEDVKEESSSSDNA